MACVRAGVLGWRCDSPHLPGSRRQVATNVLKKMVRDLDVVQFAEGRTETRSGGGQIPVFAVNQIVVGTTLRSA